MEPACSKVCPTESIQFGEVDELQERARDRVAALHGRGVADAYLYGAPDTPGATGGINQLNAFILLPDRPETYNPPMAPIRPAARPAPTSGPRLAVPARRTEA